MNITLKVLLIILTVLIVGLAIYLGFFAGRNTMMPGSDRDKHGCIGSAGYSWCEAKQKCLRTWEEECNQQKNTQNNQGKINYCTENRDQELIDKVKAEPKVKEFLSQDFPAGNMAKVEVDSKTNSEITIHVYEIVAPEGDLPGHTATMDWYYLSCQGEITGTMQNNL